MARRVMLAALAFLRYFSVFSFVGPVMFDGAVHPFRLWLCTTFDGNRSSSSARQSRNPHATNRSAGSTCTNRGVPRSFRLSFGAIPDLRSARSLVSHWMLVKAWLS